MHECPLCGTRFDSANALLCHFGNGHLDRMAGTDFRTCVCGRYFFVFPTATGQQSSYFAGHIREDGGLFAHLLLSGLGVKP